MTVNDQMIDNARSVVAYWRDSPPSRATIWNEPARSAPPSETVLLTAGAFAAIAATADEQVNMLATYGFMPVHFSLLNISTIASETTRKANELYEWAAALKIAETEQVQ